jgi:hypothetical protein
MDYLANIIPPELLFHNPIENQWKLLLEEVHYNTIIVDLDNNLAFVCLYVNRETGKSNGFYLEDISENTLSNIAKLYTFDLPVVVLLLSLCVSTSEAGTEDNYWEVQQDTYIKTLDTTSKLKNKYTKLETLCTLGRSYFQQCSVTKDTPQPTSMGMVSTSKCTLSIQTNKRNYRRIITKSITILLDIVEYPLLRTEEDGEFESLRKENRKIKDKQEDKRDRERTETLEYREHVEEVKAKNREIKQQLELRLEQQKRHKEIVHRLNTTRCRDIRKLIDLENNTVLAVYGFKKIETKFGPHYILACRGKEVKNLCVYWGCKELDIFLQDHCADLFVERDNGVYCSSEKEMFSFRKIGVGYNAKRNKQVKIEVLTINEPSVGNNNNKMEELQKINAKVTEAKPIDKIIASGVLTVGDIVEVVGYRKLHGGITPKLILELVGVVDGVNHIVLANHWLKQIFAAKEPLNMAFAVMVGENKITPAKNREHSFLIYDSEEEDGYEEEEGPYW